MNNPSAKTKAVIAYLTFIGWIIAFFMNKDNRHEFATWHIKNMFGLLILLFASIALQDYLIGYYIYWISAILWLFSLIMCLLNRQLGIPFLSEKFQTWFTFLD
ncbi:MAG: hypothetical protein AAFP76_10245 [Bacteroidota bacterium]